MPSGKQPPPRDAAREVAGLGPAAGLAGAALLALCLWKAGDAGAQDGKLEAYGRHLVQECTSCHRVDGIDNSIPSIVGWQADVFVATMKFYQSGVRTNPVMVSVANSLDDKQLRALAAYLGSLPKPAARAGRKPPGK